MQTTPPSAATARRRRSLYREAMEVIAADCGHGVTIDRVARKIATSRRQLQRAFSEAGDTTFSAALRDVRMNRAAVLLARPTAEVGTVADRVGYQEPSQFTKAFRRHHGVTPRAMRERLADRRAHARAASRPPTTGRAGDVTASSASPQPARTGLRTAA